MDILRSEKGKITDSDHCSSLVGGGRMWGIVYQQEIVGKKTKGPSIADGKDNGPADGNGRQPR